MMDSPHIDKEKPWLSDRFDAVQYQKFSADYRCTLSPLDADQNISDFKENNNTI
jgi:hypothetical protein